MMTSPAFGADNTMYMSASDGFRAATILGSIKWVQSSVGDCRWSSPALTSDGYIYVGSANYYIYSLFTSGSVKWSFRTGGPVYASPTVDKYGYIYIGSTDANLYCLNYAGSIIWSYYMYTAVKSSAAITSGQVVYVGTTGGMMFAINTNGLPAWFISTGSGKFDISSPAVSQDGSIYIGSMSDDHSLYSFSAIGSIQWFYISDGPIYCSPSIGPDGSIFFTAYQSNFVYSLTGFGSLKWKYTMSSYSSSPSPVIGADGMIYVASDHLYALYPSGSLQWISLINTYPQTPVIAKDGVIYAAASSSMYKVGTTLSTLSPSQLPSLGLQTNAESSKFRSSISNNVSYNNILFASLVI